MASSSTSGIAVSDPAGHPALGRQRLDEPAQREPLADRLGHALEHLGRVAAGLALQRATRATCSRSLLCMRCTTDAARRRRDAHALVGHDTGELAAGGLRRVLDDDRQRAAEGVARPHRGRHHLEVVGQLVGEHLALLAAAALEQRARDERHGEGEQAERPASRDQGQQQKREWWRRPRGRASFCGAIVDAGDVELLEEAQATSACASSGRSPPPGEQARAPGVVVAARPAPGRRRRPRASAAKRCAAAASSHSASTSSGGDRIDDEGDGPGEPEPLGRASGGTAACASAAAPATGSSALRRPTPATRTATCTRCAAGCAER